MSRDPSPGVSDGSLAPIICDGCSEPNGADRKFCSKCGQSLWETCEKCGTAYPIGERFCGACGADLVGLRNSKREKFEQELKRAIGLLQESNFDNGLDVLRVLADETDSRLKDLVQKAEHLRQRGQQEKQHQLEFASKALAKAKGLTKTHAYEQIIGLLTDVPEKLRNDELKALLSVADSRRKEVLALSGDIRIAVESDDYLDLMPKLQRMLELLPNHKQAKELIDRVRRKLIKSAQKDMARCQYRRAKLALERIPHSAQTRECVELAEEANEILCLVESFRNAPLIDRSTLAIADKLLKTAPKDPQVAKMRAKLKERLKSRSKDPRRPIPSWAASPQKTHFGFAVDWLGGCRSIKGWQDLGSKDHAQHRGAFFVACGLALQSLDRAHVKLNLVPPEKKGLFGALTRKRRKGPVLSAWGFDVGPSAIKVVHLVTKPEPDSDVTVKLCKRIEYSKRLTQAENVQEEKELIHEALEPFVQEHELEEQPIAVSIRGSRVIGRFFRLPPMDSKTVADAIKYEVKNQVPLPEDEIVWDYHMQEDAEDPEEEDNLVQRRVTIAATRESHARERIEPFQDLKLKVDVLQSECLALYNFAYFEFFGKTDETEPAPPSTDGIALLDVGSDSSNLVVCLPRRVWFRTFGGGGDEFTKATVQPFKLTFEQAEKVKHNPASAPRLSKLFYEYQGPLSSLVGEIDRSIGAFSRENTDCSVVHLYTVGGGSSMFGLLANLRNGASEDHS